ncbi:MAG: tetratricopeptide repeat protein [Patiriisocius sp.]|uniref:tetratricopeptide repeat protein n=1 Tax=Patiriisocius sp. TaxID=2822396 RepID=UPI003EF39CA5
MKLKYIFIAIFFGNFIFPTTVFAQEDEEPTDDLGNVTDAFQENFYEALKQKSIENYELAIKALEKAKAASKGNKEADAIVYFELAKNQTELKYYDTAEENYNKVLQTNPDKLEVLEALYDLYYLKRDYDKAIPLVERLSVIDEDYKEDLANLYSRTKQYNKSLAILDELDESWGESTYRNALRNQIYKVTGDSQGAIENLETKVDKNPKNERDYLNLIYLYSDEENTEKAFETAKELQKNIPKSELVHLALYKFYLDESNAEEALKSMKVVFKSEEIDKESQYKVLGDFLTFVDDNPQYETKLEETVSLFSKQNNGQVFEKLGDYYVTKENKEAALKFYEKGIKLDADNFSLLKNTLLLQIDFGNFEASKKLSETGLEVFPAQPLVYLLHGVSLNNLNDFDGALETLDAGIDFLFDDPKMEKDFYEQLSIAHTGKGDTKKASEFANKAAAIQISN